MSPGMLARAYPIANLVSRPQVRRLYALDDAQHATADEGFADVYEMSAGTAAELYALIDRAQIPIWIDGGWAVDALLGEQTRPHEDLDIVVQTSDLPEILKLYASAGIVAAGEDYALPWNFLLRDDSSIQVDIHAIWFTKTGIPMYGPTDKAVEYPDLSGRGAIAGLPVKCSTAQSIVEGRTGFTLRERDVHDVALLCARFGIPMPDEYSLR